jgi:hypothetical protein
MQGGGGGRVFDPGITRREGWYFNILGLAFANYRILMSDVRDKLQHSVCILHVSKMYTLTILLKKTKNYGFHSKVSCYYYSNY